MTSKTSDLLVYNVVPINGSESKDRLRYYKEAAAKCLAQEKYRQEGLEIPANWKEIMGPWVEMNSAAAALLDRRDVRNPQSFFDKLIERKESSSTSFSLEFSEWINQTECNYVPDVHLKNCGDYFERVTQRHAAQLDATCDRVMEGIDETMTKQAMMTKLRENVATLKKEVKEDSVEIHSHDYMMSLTGRARLDLWDVEGKAPKEAKSHEICDWLTKNLANTKETKVAFAIGKHGGGTVVPSSRPMANNNNNNARTERRDDPAGYHPIFRPPQAAKTVNKPHVSHSNARAVEVKTKPAEQQGQKRKKEIYSGPPCQKCPIGSEAARTHSTDRHKDNYVKPADYHRGVTKK
jgi:hypothetical protein